MSANKVRVLVVAQIVGGKTQSEVSRDMGIPLGAVKSHWRLYKAIKDEIEDDPEISCT